MLKKIISVLTFFVFTNFTFAQIYLSANGLTASGTGTAKTVALGGALTSPTILDFTTSTTATYLVAKGSSNYFFISNTGFVGIGTATPTVPLEVKGAANSTGLKFTSINNSATATINTGIGKALGLDASGNVILTATNAYNSSSVSTFGIGNATTGSGQVAFGPSALAVNSTGYQNTALGFQTLKSNTTGNNNVAIGWNALSTNLVGNSNVAIGTNALLNNNSTLGSNVAIGNYSMSTNTTGYSNTTVGNGSLSANTTGFFNSAFGTGALITNTIGERNTAIGYQSLSLNLSGVQNTAIGSQTLYNNTGTSNTGIGSGSLIGNTTGNGNTTIGATSGKDNTIGEYNTYVGFNTGAGVTTGSNNTIIGARVIGLSTSLSNTIILADGAGTTRLYINNSGNAGFGTNTPTTKLEINNGSAGSGLKFTQLTSTTNDKALSVDASGNVILVTTAAVDGSSTKVTAGTYTTVTGTGTTTTPYVINANGPFINATLGTGNIINTNSGGVIIGTGITTTPTGYNLYVSKGILTEKVKAALTTSSNWADYVFDKNYTLLPLASVEAYINKNKHLPGVPSAQQLVNEGGIDMNEMFAKQMEKIEELTLYIIDQNKKIETLQNEIKKIKK
jgi:trimeric autotransporter adhesin